MEYHMEYGVAAKHVVAGATSTRAARITSTRAAGAPPHVQLGSAGRPAPGGTCWCPWPIPCTHVIYQTSNDQMSNVRYEVATWNRLLQIENMITINDYI